MLTILRWLNYVRDGSSGTAAAKLQSRSKEVSFSEKLIRAARLDLSQACSSTSTGFEQLSLLLYMSQHELARQEYLPASEASLVLYYVAHAFGKRKRLTNDLTNLQASCLPFLQKHSDENLESL